MVEQGTHKPLVGSSNLPPGIFIWRGLISFEDRTADITSARLLILMPALRNTCAVLRIQLNALAKASKLWRARKWLR